MTSKAAEPRKKLIEHSIPLEAINKASAREKSVRHGHPSTLHLWWARRPLAACRAVLFAQLVDDPSAWPDRFKTEAEQDKERQRLHDVIKAMVEWPKSSAADQKRFERAIEAARWEIARSVAWGSGEEPPSAKEPTKVFDFLQTRAPPVYDPFSGGGSIPLEAQRLGLRAYGSDLNPVAVLISKALIEFPPKFANLPPVHPDAKQDKSLLGREWRGAQGLAEDVRRYGQWMRDEAEKRIGHLYPKVDLPNGEKATVIAWLWARTAASPDPALKGAHVPLASSFLLSAKSGQEAIVVPVKDATARDGWRFEVKSEGVSAKELAAAKDGTKSARGANFICALSGAAISSDYVKSEGKKAKLRARLMCVVAEGERGRVYCSPVEVQEVAAAIEKPTVPELDQRMPENPRWFSPPDYGMPLYSDLFTPRQVAALSLFSDLVSEARGRVLADARKHPGMASQSDRDQSLAEGGGGAVAYADAIATYLDFAVTKLADRSTTICTWDPGAVGKSSTGSAGRAPGIRNTFGRQAIPMSWDYAEINPLSETVANFQGNNEWIGKVLDNLPARGVGGVSSLDAAKNGYPIRPVSISTDPPYYDNIGYADLSDFFYLWSRRTLSAVFPDIFRRILTPKNEELVATPYRHGGKEAAELHFMKGMSEAISAMRAASADGPLCIYYAFKQSEVRSDGLFSPGWAAFLQAVVDAGLQIDGTWPIRTEMATRQVASGTNALAASVVLVCRKRMVDAPISSRRDFLRELKPVMEQAIVDHQKAGIPLPDRRQAAIGPGIGVFSKYGMVREADDSAMRVATALTLINKEIDSALGTGTQEMDAETRFALQWFEQNGYRQIEGGAGAAISQLQGFDLSEARINASGVFRAKSGNAKLLSREEMYEAALVKHRAPWRPAIDDNLTVWELAQHMARALLASDGGIDAAGRLLTEARVHAPDVQLVAERLFELATAKALNEEARVWSQLQGSWAEIEAAADRAAEEGAGAVSDQTDMFEDE